MKEPTYTTQAEVRAAFWREHPDASRETLKSCCTRIYVCDTRCAFVDFVDQLARSGEITEALAGRVTL